MKRFTNILVGVFVAIQFAGFSTLAAAAAFPDKYHPGHYLKVFPDAPPEYYKDVYDSIEDKTHVAGIMKRYAWKDLEPIKNRYDFSEIESDLAYLKSINKRLIVHFDDAGHEILVPLYLRSDYYDGGYFVGPGIFKTRYVAKRWNTRVAWRIWRLMQALGERFNKESHFEGVSLVETSVRVEKEQWEDEHFTPDKLTDGIMKIMSRTKAAFPDTVVFINLNYIMGGKTYLAEIAEHAYQIGVGLSGPNLRVDGGVTAYPHWEQYAGNLPLSIGVEYSDYDRIDPATGKQVELWQIQNYARDNLHANYIFWVRRVPLWQEQILPLINANPVLND